MKRLGIDWLSRRPAAPPQGEAGTLPRLATLGRTSSVALAALGFLACFAGSAVLLAEASGLVTGSAPEGGFLLGAGLICGALGVVAAGLARAAVSAGEAGRAGAFPDAVLVTLHGRGGDVAAVEHAAGLLAGAAGDGFGAGQLFERVLVADRPAFLAAVAAAAAGSEAVGCDVRLRCAAQGAGHVPMEVRAVPAGPGRARLVWREAGALKQKAESEARARIEAEAANDAKTRFLAAMSHELRTPLNAILGFSELLATEAGATLDDARKADYARIIHESGQHLLGLVNDILDLSRVEAGAYALSPEPIDLCTLVDGCMEMVALDATRGGVALRASLPARPPAFEGDKRAVRQMVLNLMVNAVKFTPPGGEVNVVVRARRDGLALMVRDDGPGMAAEDVARLGEPFFQAGDAAQKARGSGLGLAIVKGLVALHGGRFAVESAPGRGTTVTLHLPSGPAARAADAQPSIARMVPAGAEEGARRVRAGGRRWA